MYIWVIYIYTSITYLYISAGGVKRAYNCRRNLIHTKCVFWIFRCQSIWVGFFGDNLSSRIFQRNDKIQDKMTQINLRKTHALLRLANVVSHLHSTRGYIHTIHMYTWVIYIYTCIKCNMGYLCINVYVNMYTFITFLCIHELFTCIHVYMRNVYMYTWICIRIMYTYSWHTSLHLQGGEDP